MEIGFDVDEDGIFVEIVWILEITEGAGCLIMEIDFRLISGILYRRKGVEL